ncbi:YD repeat protein [Pseudomonas syringae pv. apii]|uniref:YD repeat protein n=1 Tax=Pseudomonas syringae pv. apii TaxID=81036 RepID=A0A3M5WH61_9PSED|nr:YD repeat protein [Pseudomonas syringae pv. apii]
MSDMERDDLHREIYRTQGKLTSCFGYDALGRKTWQYATTLPAEKLSQIQNPLIKPERYVEHAYNPVHRRYEYDPAGELSRTLDKLRGEVTYEYEANGRLLEHNPEKRFNGEEFRYDAAGNRLNFNTSGKPSPTTAKTAWSKPKPWLTVRWKAPAATSTTAWADALANSGRSRGRKTRNAFSGRDCGCCVKRVLSRAAFTSTNPAAMRRSPVLISAKVRWRTGFITSTPTRLVRRWR